MPESRTAEEIGRDWEKAGWKKVKEGKAVFYTQEVLPPVTEKVQESARSTQKQ